MVTFDDGARTTLESWGDTGQPIICIHGITSSRKSWERTAQALCASHRVFAYDQRGHGDSAGIAGPMTLERSVTDLGEVARIVGEPAQLIGHSWGGAVALLAGRKPLATRVVTIDPMVVVEPGTWRKEYLDDAETDLAMPPDSLESELRRRLSAWHESDLVGKLHAIKQMKAATIARLGSDNRVDVGGWDWREAVVEYPKPLLLLAAAPGESVLSQGDLAFIRKRGGANVEIQVFEDQGHNLHRTAFERYIGAVKAFLDRKA
jgi:pimeloyl-ACP methyl ester carboxylesterase